MKTKQSLTSQNPVSTETRPRRSSLNNDRLFVFVVSVLLVAIISGLAVYFWQRSVNEKELSVLKQKVTSLERQILIIGDKNSDNSYVKLDNINMNLDAWNLFLGSIHTAYKVNKNIQFKYPTELYLKDYSSQNSTIWLENENVSNQTASVTIEISPNQLKGSVEQEKDVRKINITINGLNATRYESSKGVAYDLLNPDDENEVMSFQITFWGDNITSEEKLAGKKVIEQIVNSFHFTKN